MWYDTQRSLTPPQIKTKSWHLKKNKPMYEKANVRISHLWFPDCRYHITDTHTPRREGGTEG